MINFVLWESQYELEEFPPVDTPYPWCVLSQENHIDRIPREFEGGGYLRDIESSEPQTTGAEDNSKKPFV